LSVSSPHARAGASRILGAGRWFLESGIQQHSGGVARYYLADRETPKPISTEITGYAASIFVRLYRLTSDDRYLDAARKAADFLVRHAWDSQLQTFAFEIPAHFTYFFDCGIIIRGLAALWRETRESRLIEVASEASHGMIRDFRAGRCYHPILTLPRKEPLAREPRWSKEPGCYQLKSALAWHEIARITNDAALGIAFEDALSVALASHGSFLPGAADRHAVMDRLHAYCYFLEGLVAFLDRDDCASAFREGIARVASLLREIAPEFARSDVYAQLLRVRLAGMNIVPLDREAAAHEADELAKFQLSSDDPRINGAWTFGRRDNALSPHVNPVSTAFAIEALELWGRFEAGDAIPCEIPI
jgi:hypothetical protein